MQAKDLMTKEVVVIKPDATIGEVMKKLIQGKISGVPVVNDSNEIVGMVTEKDLLVSYDFMRNTEQPVKDFMSRDVVGISENTSAESISRLLVQKNIKRVPVLDGKQILGIVSRRDVLDCIVNGFF